MRGKLSSKTRLQISVTRLRNNNLRFRSMIRELRVIIKEKDREIASLKEQLIDKEAQRKELQSYLWKPARKNCASPIS
ncbi:MAG: hypothetical protein RL536_335 [Candidatus Parcubacteria bacterium]